MNYYRRYVGDYLRDTSRLSMLEHGAYTLLLDYYYADEQPLPLDRAELYMMVRAMTPADRKAVDKVLALYFTEADDGYHQKRVDHEIAVSRKARDNGKNGGRPKTGLQTGGETGSQTELLTGEVTGAVTGSVTGAVTGSVTGAVTGAVTEQGGGSGHPPTTNHQPPTNQPPTTIRQPDDSFGLTTEPVQVVFAYWQAKLQHPQAKLTKDRRKKIQWALDHYDVPSLCKAIDGCAVTPHNMGQNDRGEKYDDISLILRDAAHVERFMRNADNPPTKPGTKPRSNDDFRTKTYTGTPIDEIDWLKPQRENRRR